MIPPMAPDKANTPPKATTVTLPRTAHPAIADSPNSEMTLVANILPVGEAN